MRTTWLILLLTILAGGIMYYIAKKEEAPASADTIVITDTPDSIRNHTQVYFASQPSEVLYKDSTWTADSIALKAVDLSQPKNNFDKHYKTITFFLDYGHQYFYDLEIPKPDTLTAYRIHFGIIRSNDSAIVNGSISSKKEEIFRFSGPMMKMYKSFLLSYNNRLPTDSATAADSSRTKATKTITVIKQ